MEDYASLRQENMNLEQQNCLLHNNLEELNKEFNSIIVKNEDLQKKLHITKMEAEHNMRWTRSSILLDSIQKNQSTTRRGIGFSKTNNPNIDCLCSHCGLTGPKSYACYKKQTAHKKIFIFVQRIQKENKTKPISTQKNLPSWGKKYLIHPFYNKQGPK
ncbi:hypothetical protein R3W88_033718 [Solanum pinnatisectum]|uniref:Uncharacterized protein n=1 Tax=Solanum pinnatisectum TaxID=50273 RepID=A0AAV9K0A8_9SOLN|nr:hypothetical protein R3W88_033718 [Solanum pinnatisectum]